MTRLPRSRRTGLWPALLGFIGALAIVVAVAAPGSEQPAVQVTPSVLRAVAAPTLSVELENQGAAMQEQHLRLRAIATPFDGGSLGVFATPGDAAPSQVLPAVNELGSPLTLLAVERQGDWYRVLLPTRPNGSSAWVPVPSVTVTAAPYRAEISLSGRTLHVIDNATGAVVITAPVGIGASGTPTPTGEFFVRDHFPTGGGDSHPYGPFAFGLSGHSDVFMKFGTGDGRIAIHGTNQPASIGDAVSNGCVHVDNDTVLGLIPYLPLGSPVTITA